MKAALAMALLLTGCAAARIDAKQRATLLADKGRTSEAADVLVSHLREHPQAIPERRLLIRVYAMMGQLGLAQKQAEELARRLEPNSPIPWVELGFAMEFAHRYDEALALYDRAAELAPADAIGPFSGGTRAARWGELELAEPRLREALRRDPRNARAWHALGVVRLKLGDIPGAEQAYRSGLRADGDALENRVGLATAALARDDASAALIQYDAILVARPGFADAYLGRSYALLKLGRLDDARKALEEGARLGASPRAVTAQRRVLAQADRRAERPVKASPPKAISPPETTHGGSERPAERAKPTVLPAPQTGVESN